MVTFITAVQRDKDGYIITRDSNGNLTSKTADSVTLEIQAKKNKRS